jgi:hypothetical protein
MGILTKADQEETPKVFLKVGHRFIMLPHPPAPFVGKSQPQGRGKRGEKRGAVGAQRPRTPFFAQYSPPRDGEGPGVGSFQPDFEKAIRRVQGVRKVAVAPLDREKSNRQAAKNARKIHSEAFAPFRSSR